MWNSASNASRDPSIPPLFNLSPFINVGPNRPALHLGRNDAAPVLPAFKIIQLREFLRQGRGGEDPGGVLLALRVPLEGLKSVPLPHAPPDHAPFPGSSQACEQKIIDLPPRQGAI